MNEYIITALPKLPELGAAPPIGPAELLEHVAGTRTAAEAIRLVALGQDLRQRDAFLSNENTQPQPVVLSLAQVRNDAPLPPPLDVAPEDAPAQEITDATWAAYYRHAAARAAALGSTFLSRWIQHEVSLRNALARARAQHLGMEATPYLVAIELGGAEASLTSVVNEWSAAKNHIAGLRILDLARLAWISANEPYFSFNDDELVAYAARLMILHRWHRLASRDARVTRTESMILQGASP